jgi:hypothetical protein
MNKFDQISMEIATLTKVLEFNNSNFKELTEKVEMLSNAIEHLTLSIKIKKDEN